MFFRFEYFLESSSMNSYERFNNKVYKAALKMLV